MEFVMTTTSDSNVNAVCERLKSRSATGVKKYGVTTDRTDLSLDAWLNNLQEELMDAVIYIERARKDLK